MCRTEYLGIRLFHCLWFINDQKKSYFYIKFSKPHLVTVGVFRIDLLSASELFISDDEEGNLCFSSP